MKTSRQRRGRRAVGLGLGGRFDRHRTALEALPLALTRQAGREKPGGRGVSRRARRSERGEAMTRRARWCALAATRARRWRADGATEWNAAGGGGGLVWSAGWSLPLPHPVSRASRYSCRPAHGKKLVFLFFNLIKKQPSLSACLSLGRVDPCNWACSPRTPDIQSLGPTVKKKTVVVFRISIAVAVVFLIYQ